MSYLFKAKTLIVATIVAVAGSAATAATVSFTAMGVAELDSFTPISNPVTPDVTGTVFQNVTGNVLGPTNVLARSPWELSTTNANAEYTSVQGGGTATYTFSEAMRELTFVWGSPDSYNDLIITLTGVSGTTTINGSEVFGTPGTLASFVTISGVEFDTVTFASSVNSFEFSSIATTEVPLPAAGFLLLAGLGGLTVVSRRTRKEV